LLAAYLAGQLLALISLLLLNIPFVLTFVGVLLCMAHACWVVPRQILLSHPRAFCRLRRDNSGWALWNAAGGWQAVQLLPDSLALPGVVVLRFRLAGQWWGRGLCIPADALAPDQHRRLRLRLKFSRRRWAAPG
jgi:toxin CptA